MPKEPAKVTPIACIVQEYDVTWCGREKYRNEFVFNDAAHAIKHYAKSTTLRACPSCVSAASPAVLCPHGSPPATRGLIDR